MYRRVLAVLVAFGFATGCAITDYPVMTDAEQTDSNLGEHVVNTSGQAIIVPQIQVITTTAEKDYEFLTWVDQDKKGNQTLYTRTATNPAGSLDFAGFTFINDDRTGCWVFRAPNPVEGDSDIFDGDFQASCDGAELLFTLAATTLRVAEGGSDGAGHGSDGSAASTSTDDGSFAGLSFADKLDMFTTFIGTEPACDADCQSETGFGAWARDITLTPETLDLQFEAANGATHSLAVDGVRMVVDLQNSRLWVDGRQGNLPSVLNGLADFVETNGQEGSFSFTYAGQTGSFDVMTRSPDAIRDAAALF